MLYLFEDFALDSDRRELHGPTGLIRLEPQVFDLLLYLIRNRDRVVTKDDLIAAVWAGRIVSESALTTRINAARTAVRDSGEVQRLIKTFTRKGIRFVGAVREEQPAPSTSAPVEQLSSAPTLPDRPSIAVLPFVNISSDPDQDYFADGMAEEIITALSHCKSLFVIARNSSFTYKGKAVDVRQVGRELGVRYVLEGSVRRDGERLRFMIQLIDAISGRQIRADRFEGSIGDVFALQDRITESVVAIIEPDIQVAEIERVKHAPAASLDAYELLLRAQHLEFEFTVESLSEAIRCLDRALTLDPSYAQAMALAAHCYSALIHQGWATEPRREMDEALRLAARAVELAKDDANVLWMAAKVILTVGMDAERAKQLAYASLALNPNSAAALAVTGIIESHAFANQEKAFELFRRAERLNPRDRRGWGFGGMMAVAHLVDGQFDRAAAIAERALLQNPRSAIALRALAASLAKMGQREEATELMRTVLKIDPNITISKLRTRIMFMDEGVWQRYADGLRRAGLPE